MVPLVLSLLWMCELFSFSTAQQGPVCSYYYVQQPLMQIQCNPYERNRINLACRVEAPSEETQESLGIVWFRQRQGSEREVLVNGGLGGSVNSMIVAGDPSPNGTRIHTSFMRLELSRLNEGDIGQYWCQPQVTRNGEAFVLERSNKLRLTNEQSYNGLDECEPNPDSFSTFERTCAQFPPSIPPTVTFPDITTPSVNPTNEPTSKTTAREPERTRSQSTVDITAATTESDPSPSSNQAVVLYSVLAVIVVFVTVTINLTVVIIVILCIYKKRYNRQKPNQRVQANQPPATTDQEEDVEYDYPQLPTENSEIELKENTAYNIARLRDIETKDNIAYGELRK